MAGKVRRASDRGPTRCAAHPEVVERRRVGRWETDTSERGNTPGRQCIALLANIYLHYVFDLWVQAWRRKRACGDVIVVRFADDIVVGFQSKSEAERFWAELTERFRKFQLELHPEKTRLLEFGPYAVGNRKKHGEGKPETQTVAGEVGRGESRVAARMHDPIPEVGQWLRSVVGGHIRYYGVPMNGPALRSFRSQVGWLWYRTLSRRSQNGRVLWDRMRRLIARWLPPARISHPYPLRRRGVVT